MIEQVVVNLLDNAIKYSDKTTEIDITISGLTDAVKISITDHGAGIKESDRPNVIKRYFKSDLGNINVEGLGLGLYNVQKLLSGIMVILASNPFGAKVLNSGFRYRQIFSYV